MKRHLTTLSLVLAMTVAVVSFATTTDPSASSFAGNLNIVLKDKRFIPGEASANDGDTVRICNNDIVFHRPFSYTKNNRFEPAQIKPGECMDRVVQNPTRIPLCVKFHDELHSKEELVVAVEPKGRSASLNGTWNIVQTTSNGARYAGTMKLTQSGKGLSGTVDWDNHTQGSLRGSITQCNKVEFSLTYGGGLVGTYNGTLDENGTQMIDGNARSNKGGPPVAWHAGR